MGYKISVVIPIHNSEKFLCDCMESLKAQTFSNFELLCMINGSTDNSLNYIKNEAAKDERIKYYVYDMGNAGFARNQGLKYAKGEYIIFLDSDDFFEPTLLQALYNKAQDTGADIAMCGGYTYNDRSKKRVVTKALLDEMILKGVNAISPIDYCDVILNISRSIVWNRLYKREFVMNKNILFQEIRANNDAYFSVITLLLATKIAFVYEPLVNYRTNTGISITNVNKKDYRDILLVIKEVDSYVKKNNLLAYRKATHSFFIFNLISHFVKLVDRNKKESMVLDFNNLDLGVIEVSYIDAQKPSFCYIFIKFFMQNRVTVLAKILDRSRVARKLFDVIISPFLIIERCYNCSNKK